MMRTTLTLDDDVAAKLAADARRSGRSFKETVNDYLRRGLNTKKTAKVKKPFKVRARALGLRSGLNYDDIWGLIEQVEGRNHR
jgi:plasmid stability protein